MRASRLPAFRTLALWALLLSVAVLAGCASTPAVIQPDLSLKCGPDRGMGGTGIVALDRGMGGTGLTNQDRGMGGTGAVALDRGIGGTGIIGTVTGFGSICVNGFRVAYTASTPVTVDGVAASLAALERGATVAVMAAPQAGELHASSIEIVHALVGPVTASATASGAVAVMGLTIESTNATGTPTANLAVGDLVAVDGLQRPDGTIDATRIAPAPNGSRASIRGVVRRAGSAVQIGSVPVTAAPETLPADGAWATASGVWADGALKADRVVAGLEIPSSASERLSIEGYLVLQPDGRYAIRGTPLRDSPGLRLDRATFARIAAGQRVQVLGQRQVDGSMRPETLIVPDRLSPLSSDIPAPSTTAAPSRVATEPSTDAAADAAASGRTASPTPTTTTVTRPAVIASEPLQVERGVYGAALTRPLITREVTPIVRPNAIPTRPNALPTRPDVVPTRPALPTRPERVVRPEVQQPVRPEIPQPVRPEIPRPVGRPGQ